VAKDVFREAPMQAPPAPREVTPDQIADAQRYGLFARLFGGMAGVVGGGVALVLGALMMLSHEVGRGRGAYLAIPVGLGLAYAVLGGLLHVFGRVKRANALETFREGVEAFAEPTEAASEEDEESALTPEERAQSKA
jgi:hypothetical protein